MDYAALGYTGNMEMETLALIALVTGSAFCAVICGAVLTERPGESSLDEMHALFDMTPDAV